MGNSWDGSWDKISGYYTKNLSKWLTYDVVAVAKLVESTYYTADDKLEGLKPIMENCRLLFRDALMEAGLVDESVLKFIWTHSVWMARKVLCLKEHQDKELSHEPNTSTVL